MVKKRLFCKNTLQKTLCRSVIYESILKLFYIQNLHEQGYISYKINFFEKCLWTRQLTKEYDVFSGRASPPLSLLGSTAYSVPRVAWGKGTGQVAATEF
jgi:hypothetical protein